MAARPGSPARRATCQGLAPGGRSRSQQPRMREAARRSARSAWCAFARRRTGTSASARRRSTSGPSRSVVLAAEGVAQTGDGHAPLSVAGVQYPRRRPPRAEQKEETRAALSRQAQERRRGAPEETLHFAVGGLDRLGLEPHGGQPRRRSSGRGRLAMHRSPGSGRSSFPGARPRRRARIDRASPRRWTGQASASTSVSRLNVPAPFRPVLRLRAALRPAGRGPW